MRRIFFFMLPLLAVILLSGCTEHQYKYTPPDAVSDKACVARCTSGRNSCERICHMKYTDCMGRGGLFCKPKCPCVVSYNTCYSACGGQVKTLL